MSAPRVRFADASSAIFPFVFGLFWIVGAFITFAGIVGLASGSIPLSSDSVIGGAILLTAMTWFTWFIRGTLRVVRTIALAPDGAWILRSNIGRELGRIPAEQPRSMQSFQRKVWTFSVSARRFTQSWVMITAGGRTWRSASSIPSYQAKAVQALQRPPFGGGTGGTS